MERVMGGGGKERRGEGGDGESDGRREGRRRGRERREGVAWRGEALLRCGGVFEAVEIAVDGFLDA